MAYISVDECRTILGPAAEGQSDKQIEELRDSLERVAVVMYDEIARHVQKDPDSVRWAALAFENPAEADGSEIPDEFFPTDGPNLLDFSDEEL